MRICKHSENWDTMRSLSARQFFYIRTIYNTGHFSQCTELYCYIFIVISDPFQWNISWRIALKKLISRPFHFSPRVQIEREQEIFCISIVSLVNWVVSVLLSQALKNIEVQEWKLKVSIKLFFHDSLQKKIWDKHMPHLHPFYSTVWHLYMIHLYFCMTVELLLPSSIKMGEKNLQESMMTITFSNFNISKL